MRRSKRRDVLPADLVGLLPLVEWNSLYGHVQRKIERDLRSCTGSDPVVKSLVLNYARRRAADARRRQLLLEWELSIEARDVQPDDCSEEELWEHVRPVEQRQLTAAVKASTWQRAAAFGLTGVRS